MTSTLVDEIVVSKKRIGAVSLPPYLSHFVEEAASNFILKS